MASPEGVAANWLLLTYRVPAKPASLRAAVRRKLTAAGAVYLSSACAIAPLSRPAERAMRRIRATISGAGGSAVLMAACALSGELELTGACNAVCDREYQAVIGDCLAAVADLGTLRAACEPRFQHLWRHDLMIRRLSSRYRAVRSRDVFDARLAQDAESALVGYRSAIDEYVGLVLAVESGPSAEAWSSSSSSQPPSR